MTREELEKLREEWGRAFDELISGEATDEQFASRALGALVEASVLNAGSAGKIALVTGRVPRERTIAAATSQRLHEILDALNGVARWHSPPATATVTAGAADQERPVEAWNLHPREWERRRAKR